MVQYIDKFEIYKGVPFAALLANAAFEMGSYQRPALGAVAAHQLHHHVIFLSCIFIRKFMGKLHF